MGQHEMKVWLANLVAHAVVSIVAYVLLRGYRLPVQSIEGDSGAPPVIEFDRRHWITIVVIAAWIVGVVAFKLSVGLAAFAAAAIVVLASAADEASSIRKVPWWSAA